MVNDGVDVPEGPANLDQVVGVHVVSARERGFLCNSLRRLG